jgi:glutathione reductase (NADPH)
MARDSKDYDLVVIGSGPAGQGIIYECKSAGLRIAMVEAGELGGTCPLRGCDPKKVLAGAGEVIGRVQGMAGKGIQSRTQIDWAGLIRFKRTFTDPIPEEMERRLAEFGVDIFHGSAHFSGPRTLRVGKATLEAKNIVIAAGATPQKLNIPGEEHVALSRHFLEMEELPGSMVFIGDGYISFEFAHMAARAGSRVTVLHRSGKPLKHFDPDLVRMLVEESRRIGVEVHVNTPVYSVKKKGKEYVLYAGENGDRVFHAGLVVHGAGRVPNIQNLELERGGVKTSPRGILVNEHLQSPSNPAVYAGGDAAATLFYLTPTANLEGRVIGRNILSGNQEKADYRGVPSVVFTFPPLAAVGLSEEELKQSGVKYGKKFADSSSWFESRRIGLGVSGLKVFWERNSRKLLGAHLLGSHAEEAINLFALAIRLELTMDELLKTPWVYPSSVSEIGYLES